MINEKYLKKFNGNPGVDKKLLLDLNLPDNTPSDYLSFLQLHNGGEGFIGEEYLILYKVEDLKQMNANYEVEKFTPGIFLIGSNGGGEAIAFDLRENQSKVILIPFMFEYDAIIELGKNMEEFFQKVYEKGYFG
ncbi:MAG: SMI1/KNR4 family protein [Candidatus Dojkabacteria bacterium]|nr:MAG: SMI1/KNR4 family protein [Candidatus Dojkabacteria bacterium]